MTKVVQNEVQLSNYNLVAFMEGRGGAVVAARWPRMATVSGFKAKTEINRPCIG